MPDRILVADDEPDTLDLTRIILEKRGYSVVTAVNGEQALQKAESEMPDLILLDVSMPGRSGYEVCKILKSKPRTKLIPVVMFTVLGRDVDRRMGMEAGAEGYHLKPFEASALVAEIRKHVEKIRPEKFANALGVTHSELRNRKILLEFDPALPYERVVRDFALESRAHEEAVHIMASKSSVIYRTLGNEKDLEFVPPTDPLPSPIMEIHKLGFADRGALTARVLSPIIEAHKPKPFTMVYDSITEEILSVGFQTAYNFTREALELLADYDATALFLLNPLSHPLNERSSIRSLFSERVAFTENGLVTVKLA